MKAYPLLEKWIARALIVALALGYLGMRSCGTAIKKVIQKDVVIEQRSDSLQHYKDAYGTEHAQLSEARANTAGLRQMYGSYIDTLTARLDIKEKQLQAFATIGTQTTGSVQLAITKEASDAGDTVRRFSYSDRWLDVTGAVYDAPHLSQLTYAIRDSLTYTSYWRRTWFLGRKSYYIDAYSLNPATTITGLTGARVAQEKAGRIGIGPFIGYGFDGKQWRTTAGISLHYSLLRF